jgi:SAM-dependent methyltransferase
MATDQPRNPADSADVYRSLSVAERWQRGAAGRAGTLGPVTEAMLDLAGIRPSHRVLDVAAGTGEQTLMVARRVGPDGYVLATDISAEMLDVAAESVRSAGLSNVETQVLDAQALNLAPASFDAAICRSGLMLMSDPVAALVGIRRALKAGGRLAALVFGRAEQNPLQWLPTLIARGVVGTDPPAPGEPGMFALSGHGSLEAAFQAAGFWDVVIEAIPSERRFGSAAEAVRTLRDALPSVHALLTRIDEAQRKQVWTEIERALEQFEGPDGSAAPSEMLIGHGTA